MPMGRSAVTSFITCATLRPSARISPPSRMAMAKPIADLQSFIARLHRTGGAYDVLRLKRRDQGRAVNSERREPLHRELDENFLVLGAKDLDFGNVRHVEQARS